MCQKISNPDFKFSLVFVCLNMNREIKLVNYTVFFNCKTSFLICFQLSLDAWVLPSRLTSPMLLIRQNRSREKTAENRHRLFRATSFKTGRRIHRSRTWRPNIRLSTTTTQIRWRHQRKRRSKAMLTFQSPIYLIFNQYLWLFWWGWQEPFKDLTKTFLI